MAKWICKVNVSDAWQYRITIPSGVIRSKRWGGMAYVMLEERGGDIILKRFIDNESLKNDSEVDKDGTA